MNVLKSVYLGIIILAFVLSMSINSFAEGRDIWLIDGKEMEQLPNELLNKLQSDPYVREALDLENMQIQRVNALDTNNNVSSKLNPNTVSHIKTIDGTNIFNILITGKSIGIVIEKSLTDKFEIDYVGVEDINNFDFKDTIEANNTLKIEVSANSKVDYIDTTPNNKVNVINIKIPEKTYNNFYINVDTGAVYLPNIIGKVDIDSNKSSIKVVTNQLESNLNLNIQKSSLKFNVAKFSNDINIEGADTGNSVKIVFSQQPKNLKLDATKCQGSIDLPNGWSKSYEVGTGKPLINLNVKGSIKISAETNKEDLYKITTEAVKGGTAFGAGDYKLNDIVNLKATPIEGYRFIGWQIDSKNIKIDNYKLPEISFKMPAENIHIIAHFEEYKEFTVLEYKDLIFSIITEADISNNGTVSTKLDNNYNKYTNHIEIPEAVTDAYGDIYTVTKINDTAFAGLTNLKSVKLPNTINSIGNNAFEGCKNLIDIDIPKSVDFIGNHAFKSCDILKTVTIHSDNINIKNNAFSKANITFNIANKNIKTQILPFVTDEIQIHVLGEKPSLEESIKAARILIDSNNAKIDILVDTLAELSDAIINYN